MTPLPWKRNGSVAAAAAAAARGRDQIRVSHNFCPFPTMAPGTKLSSIVKYPELPSGSLVSDSGVRHVRVPIALIGPLPGREAGQSHCHSPLGSHEPCYSIRIDLHNIILRSSTLFVQLLTVSIIVRSFVSFFVHCSVCTAKWPKPKQLRREGRKEKETLNTHIHSIGSIAREGGSINHSVDLLHTHRRPFFCRSCSHISFFLHFNPSSTTTYVIPLSLQSLDGSLLSPSGQSGTLFAAVSSQGSDRCTDYSVLPLHWQIPHSSLFLSPNRFALPCSSFSAVHSD